MYSRAQLLERLQGEDGESVEPKEVLDFLDGYLARFKWPREVRVVEELPHHVTGKVLRRSLRRADEEPE